MKVLPVIVDAWGALQRNRLRSFLSILGVIFAVMAVVSMLAIAEGAKRETLEQIRGLGTDSIVVRGVTPEKRQESSPAGRGDSGLREEDAAALARAFPALLRLAPLREATGVLSAAIEQDPYDILAVTADYGALRELPLSAGRFIADADMERRQQVCVLGDDVSRALGEGGHLGESVRLQDRIFLIVGILRERSLARSTSTALAVRNYNRAIFVPLGTEPVASGDGRQGGISEIFMRVVGQRPLGPVAAAVKNVVSLNHGGVEDFQVIVPQELLFQAQRTQRLFNIVLGCIAGISLLVGGIGIMNTMLASVAERTREIGVRRAVGATREHIVFHFLCESVTLTVVGASLGILAGCGGALLISTVAGWPTVITLWSLALAVLVAAAVGLLSGIYPAVTAARLDPVVALRHE